VFLSIFTTGGILTIGRLQDGPFSPYDPDTEVWTPEDVFVAFQNVRRGMANMFNTLSTLVADDLSHAQDNHAVQSALLLDAEKGMNEGMDVMQNLLWSGLAVIM
jgi:hypothetical protein